MWNAFVLAVPRSLDGVGGVLSKEACGCRPALSRALEGSFMNHRTRLITFLVLSLSTFAGAGELPTAEPDAVGLSPAKLDQLKPAFQKLVDDGKLAAGVITPMGTMIAGVCCRPGSRLSTPPAPRSLAS
jgi:hypothetical protein